MIKIQKPVKAAGFWYVAAGYVGDSKSKPNKPVYSIRPGASGDISLADDAKQNAYVAWMATDAAPYNPSPLAYQGRLYVLWDFGFLSCRDAATGKEIYGKERFRPEGRVGFTSSPWAYNGKIFCLSEDGDTYVVQPGNEFKLVRVNPLNEMCMATPAIAHDRLFIRTQSKLYCVGAK